MNPLICSDILLFYIAILTCCVMSKDFYIIPICACNIIMLLITSKISRMSCEFIIHFQFSHKLPFPAQHDYLVIIII